MKFAAVLTLQYCAANCLFKTLRANLLNILECVHVCMHSTAISSSDGSVQKFYNVI